jgi:hypothetical protein
MTLISIILFKGFKPAGVATCSSVSHAEVQILYTKTGTDQPQAIEYQTSAFGSNFQVYTHTKPSIKVNICFKGATTSLLSIQKGLFFKQPHLNRNADPSFDNKDIRVKTPVCSFRLVRLIVTVFQLTSEHTAN